MHPGPENLFDIKEAPIINQMDALWVTSEYSKTYLRKRGIQIPILIMPPIFNGPKFEKTTPLNIPNLLIAANLVER